MCSDIASSMRLSLALGIRSRTGSMIKAAAFSLIAREITLASSLLLPIVEKAFKTYLQDASSDLRPDMSAGLKYLSQSSVMRNTVLFFFDSSTI